MIFNGEWIVPKYKITRTVVTYDDRPELYPDSTAEEITLTAEQTARLDEIRYTPMSQAEAIAYVMDGIGTPPDSRTDVDKLIDMMTDLTPEILAIAPRWTKDERYPKGHYVRNENAMYKTKVPHISKNPPEIGAEYDKVLEV